MTIVCSMYVIIHDAKYGIKLVVFFGVGLVSKNILCNLIEVIIDSFFVGKLSKDVLYLVT